MGQFPTPSGGSSAGPWTAFPLNNGWRDYSVVNPADGYGTPQYRINQGVVELRGVLEGTLSTASPVIGADGRPAAKRRVLCNNSAGATIDVQPDGSFKTAAGGNISATSFIVLDDCSYSL